MLRKSLVRDAEVDFDPEMPKMDRPGHDQSLKNAAEWNNRPAGKLVPKCSILHRSSPGMRAAQQENSPTQHSSVWFFEPLLQEIPNKTGIGQQDPD
jgi:hypothetical protein